MLHIVQKIKILNDVKMSKRYSNQSTFLYNGIAEVWPR